MYVATIVQSTICTWFIADSVQTNKHGQYGVNKLWINQRSAGKVYFSVLNNLMF